MTAPGREPQKAWKSSAFMPGSGLDAQPDGADDASPGQAAVAGRVLGQVLLVVALGEEELRRRPDLGGDRPHAALAQGLLVGRLGGLGRAGLRVGIGVD